MKCPNCGADVEKGSLYCHKCLTEVPWVPEYNTVETLLQKQEKTVRKMVPSVKKGRSRAAVAAVLVLVALFLLIGVILCVKHINSFEHQYQLALERYEEEKYSSCDRHLEKALEKKPNSLEANLLLAMLMKDHGELSSAELVLKPMLKLYPDSVSIYKMYVEVLDGLGKTEEIRRVLGECTNEIILDACSEYICKEPEISLREGTYTEPEMVYIESEYDRIYYTLDGTEPTQNSLKYEDGIPIPEGTTELSVFCVNQKNVPSNVVTRKYVVVMNQPEPPEILPEAQVYHKKTKISIKVPEGCTGYYAFDKIPTALSTVYTGPVAMPEGTHVFYAIVIGANGKKSELASRTYTVIYD